MREPGAVSISEGMELRAKGLRQALVPLGYSVKVLVHDEKPQISLTWLRAEGSKMLKPFALGPLLLSPDILASISIT